MISSILGTHVSPIDYQRGVDQIMAWAQEGESRSVYAANVHMVMEAHDHAEFRQIVNAADMVTPDGMPLVWALRLKGIKNQQRVYGPTLMLEVLAIAAEKGISVGFLGSTAADLQTLSKNMAERFPGLVIGTQIAPPFRNLTAAEDQEITKQINDSGIKILFVGLGCPKQERWIAEHKGEVNAVMVGVGAAFAFHAGIVRQAPGWMQKSGLEWFFRFSQEPGRLWRRYLINNPRFALLILIELLRERMHGLRRSGGDKSC